MMQLLAGTTFDESYSWPLLKYDSKKGEMSAKWAPPMTLAQEPRFIPNPEGKSEDDGLIMAMAYNFDSQTTSFFVIDAMTMETLQEYPLPFKLPQGFHSNYFAADELTHLSDFQ